MGREWQFRSSGGGGGGRKDHGSTAGCLGAVFQLFDFHRQVPANFTTPTISQSKDQPAIMKRDSDNVVIPGIDAPRNSLEMDEPFLQVPSLSSAMRTEDNKHIPTGMHIKTRVNKVRSTTSDYSSSPDYFSSPSAKTPTLVARLMGLDLLPDTSSPSPSYSSRSSTTKTVSKSHLKSHETIRKDKLLTGARSLPETPRSSLARKSDVDRRLSLQSNRDSIDRVGEIELSGCPRIRIVKRETREDDVVKERVRQNREGVNRRFGVEITNKVKNNRGNENMGFGNKRVESEIVLLKAKKPLEIREEMETSKYSIKLLEKEKQNQRILNREIGKKNVLKNKQTEPFVRSNLGKNRKGDLVKEKKCKKKTPLSSEFVKINVFSSPVLPMKKEPSFPPTKLPSKQKDSHMSGTHLSKCITQLSSSSSLKYRQVPADKSTVLCTNTDRSNGCVSTTFMEHQWYFQYIKDILMHHGIYLKKPITITKCSSISLSLYPSIFNQLELSHSHFSLASNRKLIFELVHEMLGEIFSSWGLQKLNDSEMCGSELVEKLCKQITSFPLANCQVLEDIDALIDGDLRRLEAHKEGNTILEEIEVQVFDSIVQDVAMSML